MIEVSKLNDKEIFINCDMIELIEATPDTTITMTTGRKVMVLESIDDIVEKVLEYKRKIYRQY